VLTAAVYAGIADRALELATEAANRVVPVLGGGEAPRLDDPDTAARLTAAVLEHRASLDALMILARDVDDRRVREDWFLALAAARNRVTDEARSAVDTAMRLVGASGFQADSELARLYRDVLAGLFHPSSSRALARTVRGSLGA
jgi:alkylation response protein AidB-like acyl-CoA dehydrogenase